MVPLGQIRKKKPIISNHHNDLPSTAMLKFNLFLKKYSFHGTCFQLLCFCLINISWKGYITGKFLWEVLLFGEHGENMLCTKIILNVRNNFCTQHVLPRFELGIFMYWTCNSMNSLSSYCGLVDAKVRASDKYLPVQLTATLMSIDLGQQS